MDEVLVRASVWLALVCYPAGAFAASGLGPTPGQPTVARRIWTVGCAAFLVHVASSFHVFYGWSHATALAETAERTEALTGTRSGAGIWLNYVFTAVWAADAGWWWLNPLAYSRRSVGVRVALHGFFLFMIVNGAIVFATGPVRWVGVAVTAAALALFSRAYYVRRMR